MSRVQIQTNEAPQAIGSYSRGVRMGNLVFLTAQIGLTADTGTLVSGITAQVEQVLKNLEAVARAAGATLAGVGKLTIYLTELESFGAVNSTLKRYFTAPFPARASVAMKELALGPKWP